MLQLALNSSEVVTTATDTVYSTVIDLFAYRTKTLSVQSIIDVATPAAKDWTSSDVNTTADTITIANHGFATGLKGQVSTASALPAPLFVSTDYYVIVVDANTFHLATSLANAEAGTGINFTTQGTGTSTFTPTTLAGASLTYQRSNDNVQFDDIQAATSIAADGSAWYTKVDPEYRYFRTKYVITAGELSAVNKTVIMGYTT